jgi:exopolysaccharide biosynthesis polyprenyl glycosylphosphotransferase
MASPGTKLVSTALFSGAKPSPNATRYLNCDLPSPGNVLRLRQSLFVTADLCGILSGALLAIVFRFQDPSGVHSLVHPPMKVAEHIGIAFLYAILVVLFSSTQELYSAYQARSRAQEFLVIFKSVLMAAIVLCTCLFVSGVKMTSRLVIASAAISALVAMFGWRQIRRRSLRTAVADGLSCHNVLIVGTDRLSSAVAQHLVLHRQLGFVVLGHIRAPHPTGESQETDLEVLGDADQIKTLCRARFVDEILICAHDRATVMKVIADARECGVGVRVIPDLYDGLAWGARLDYLGDFPSMTVVHRSIPTLAMVFKRALDVVLSALALAVLSPVFLLLALVVKLDSPGPIFYLSKRVGRKGRIFSCYKFRTMVANADELKNKIQHLNERDAILFKISKDPRITRTGAWMRKHSLDEFAQLWNVVKGDMSLVGPRPPLVTEVKQYQLDYLRRLEVAPGITGLWQVEARNNPSFDRYISLDLSYIENWSLALDINILLRTVAVVIAGTGS